MSPENIKPAVRNFREGKIQAKNYDIIASGAISKELASIMENSDGIIPQLEEEQHDYLVEKHSQLQDYLGLSYNELLEKYSNGFRVLLIQQYRLNKKDPKGQVERLEDEEYVKNLAIGYSFDFIRTLTLAKRMGISKNIALKLAEVSYWNNPNILLSLAKGYPEVNLRIIARAATRYPRDPEGFIERIILQTSLLVEKYPEIDKWVISHATIHHPRNPEEFLQKFASKKPQLEQEYPNVNPGIIQYATVHYANDPEGFIRQSIAKTSLLKDKYKVDQSVISAAVTYHPRNPEGFIERVIEETALLQEKYPEMSKWIIQYATTSNPRNPEGFIERVIEETALLQEKYPEISRETINNAVVNHPTNPEGYIEKVIEEIPYLQKKYPNVGRGIINRAVIRYSNDPEGYITRSRINSAIKGVIRSHQSTFKKLPHETEIAIRDALNAILSSIASEHSEERLNETVEEYINNYQSSVEHGKENKTTLPIRLIRLVAQDALTLFQSGASSVEEYREQKRKRHLTS